MMNVVEVIEAEIEEAVLVIGGQPVAEEKLSAIGFEIFDNVLCVEIGGPQPCVCYFSRGLTRNSNQKTCRL